MCALMLSNPCSFDGMLVDYMPDVIVSPTALPRARPAVPLRCPACPGPALLCPRTALVPAPVSGPAILVLLLLLRVCWITGLT